MSHSLSQIAQELWNSGNRVQLIYAFNGSGKTRLSRELAKLLAFRDTIEEDGDERYPKILYYNAFTEDLFYWDNDLEWGITKKLKIQPNSYTQWVLQEQGQDQNVVKIFQRYTNKRLTPCFNEEYLAKDSDGRDVIITAFSEVTFSYERGNEEATETIKISKGEESCFIWSIFYSLIDQVVSVLNSGEIADRETDRYKLLQCIFIDDPVSSLDENHLIELAVDLADLIKRSESDLRFIITTHNAVFYNVLHNELKAKTCHLLSMHDDGTFSLEPKLGDSNRSFFYHLRIKSIIEQAVAEGKVERYHFMLLRNLYEKTASFLGYQHWRELLPEEKSNYYRRILHFASHSTLSNETVAEPSAQEKMIVKFLLDNIVNTYGYRPREDSND